MTETALVSVHETVACLHYFVKFYPPYNWEPVYAANSGAGQDIYRPLLGESAGFNLHY